MNSFFQKDPTGKRYAISRRDGEPFGVAGIWENWRDPLTSAWERTFAVITVPANALIAPIHDRMLAILPNEQFPRWLSDEPDPRGLLTPFPATSLWSCRSGRGARGAAVRHGCKQAHRSVPTGPGRANHNGDAGFRGHDNHVF
jgi:putative SOS response-associated peptidase YedK